MESRITKNRIYKMLEKYERKLIEYYINNGPVKLREKLGIKTDEIWEIVLDYLVLDREVIKKCVRMHTDYIHELFVEKGPLYLRKGFYITDSKYDDAWEYLLDYVGISRGAIYEHVSGNSTFFGELIRGGKASKIRDDLGISKEKYNRVWEEILDILLDCVSTENFTHSMFEHGVQMFTKLYNSGRKHRSLIKRLTPEELEFNKKEQVEEEEEE